LIDAAVKGEQIVITKDDQTRVRLVPLQKAKPRPQFGSGKGLITIAGDFDEPLKDFEEYS
jgi:antitoxin (DNA-binding transcriptional repressor) of toxin-antitoxin stability system